MIVKVTIIHTTVDGPWTGVRLAPCSYRCVFFVFHLFSAFPSLVLSVASWGSVNLAISSSSWEWWFLYSYERYSWWSLFKLFCVKHNLVLLFLNLEECSKLRGYSTKNLYKLICHRWKLEYCTHQESIITVSWYPLPSKAIAAYKGAPTLLWTLASLTIDQSPQQSHVDLLPEMFDHVPFQMWLIS